MKMVFLRNLNSQLFSFSQYKKWYPLGLFCGLIYGLSLMSCSDTNRVYESYQEIPKYQWDYEQVLPFEVAIEDTVQRYNIAINLRHANNYAYSNLWVMLKTTYPSGKTFESRVDLPLANKMGKWYGHGSGAIISAEVPIQQMAILPEKGIYQFELTQNMRINPLPNIMDIGMRIERAKVK